MALVVQFSGVGDQTSVLVAESLTLKYLTADFATYDYDPGFVLGAAMGNISVRFSDSTTGLNWLGTLASIEIRPGTGRKTGHFFAVCSAVRTQPVVANTAPFDLTDNNPGSATDLLTTEAGDELITETGTQHFMTEGPRTVAYQELSVKQQVNLDGTSFTYGRAMIWQAGMVPGQNFSLTFSDIGVHVDQTYLVNEVTTTWPANSPIYAVEFGASTDTSGGTIPLTFRHFTGLP